MPRSKPPYPEEFRREALELLKLEREARQPGREGPGCLRSDVVELASSGPGR